MGGIRLVGLALCAMLAGSCGPGKRVDRASPPAKPEVPRAFFDLVELEGQRGSGAPGVSQLTRDAAAAVRVRATRALGRLRDPRANDRLVELLADGDPAVADAAAWALGISGDETRSQVLATRYELAVGAEARAELARAIGRVGNAAAQSVLVAGLQDESPVVREAAAIGAGMYGRRGIALSAGLRRALYGTVGHVSVDVRYGAAFALAREHEPPQDPDAVHALSVLAGDSDAGVRAVAIFGLGRRKAGSAVMLLQTLRDDGDWRVRVAAIDALLARDEVDVGPIAAMLAREWAILARHGLEGPEIHVIAEALIGLEKHAAEPIVQTAVRGLNDSAARRLAAGGDAPAGAVINASLVHCRSADVLVRAGAAGLESLQSCGGVLRRGWPRHERRRLVAQVLGDGLGGDEGAERAELLAQMRRDSDPRVRAAALEATVTHLAHYDDREIVVDALLAGLADDSVEVAGSAADALAGASTREKLEADLPRLLDALVAEARKRVDADMELRLTFLSAIKDAEATSGAPLCRAALTADNVTVRAIARECIEKLTGADPGAASGVARPALPPVDAKRLLGKRVTWTLETTRGQVVIELDPMRAPWHVAVLAKLTRDGVYNGRLWHRVVPNFVVQGGSPLDSAWGGPTFVVPGEPSPGPYERGTVGIADAGMDTGGSQFFIMHSRAPHLDGRYTIVGKVTSGMGAVDKLVVGDRITAATVSVE